MAKKEKGPNLMVTYESIEKSGLKINFQPDFLIVHLLNQIMVQNEIEDNRDCLVTLGTELKII
jgi:hypothetical protein